MKPIDAPLPMPAIPADPVTPAPEPAAERGELLALLTRITQEAKMPAGVKNARFVRLPADLYLAAHAIVVRELASFPGEGE